MRLPPPRSTPVATLFPYPPLFRSSRRARVLRRWIETLRLPPLPAQGIARIEADLLAAAADTDAVFEWHGARVRRWRDLLHAGVRREPLAPDWHAHWDGREPLALPTGGELSLEGAGAFDAPLRVHARPDRQSTRLTSSP